MILSPAHQSPPHHQAMTTAPLLSIGTFGVHLVSGSSSWSFAGCVPSDIKRGGYTTEADGIAAFVDWFKEQDVKFQRAHAADLRTDVFCAVLAA